MPGRPRPTRPTKPCDAFPNSDYTAWRQHVHTVDLEPVYAAAIAELLTHALDQRRDSGKSLRDIATEIGVNRSVLSSMSRCVTYPMVGMLAKLERALGTPLWPGDLIAITQLTAPRPHTSADGAASPIDETGADTQNTAAG